MIDKDGTQLPFSRGDVVGAVIVALALMYAFAFSLGGVDSLVKCVFALGIAGLVIALTTRRRLVFGAALSIIAVRLIFGVLFITHSAAMLLGTVLCCGLAVLLLRV